MPFVVPGSLPAQEPRPGWSGRFFDSEQAIVPADQRHSVRATEPTRAIVVDYPVRESVGDIPLV